MEVKLDLSSLILQGTMWEMFWGNLVKSTVKKCVWVKTNPANEASGFTLFHNRDTCFRGAHEPSGSASI